MDDPLLRDFSVYMFFLHKLFLDLHLKANLENILFIFLKITTYKFWNWSFLIS